MSPTTKSKEAPPRPAATPSTAPEAPAPQMTPQAAPARIEEGPGRPMLAPPGMNGGIAEAQAPETAVTAWQSVSIGGLYTSNNLTNAWAYLNGIGWRRISPANAVAHHAILQILRLARDGNLTVQCDEDGSVIHTAYVW